jgi:polysaccharide biosynthesis protein PslE
MERPNPSDHNLPMPRPSGAGAPALSPEANAFLLGRYSNATGLRDYLTTLFKHKYQILITFLVLTMLAGAGVFVYLKFLYTPLFEARSLLLVKFGWENYNLELALDPRRAAPVANQIEIVNSEVRILQSRDLKERVVSAIKVENLYPELIQDPLPGVTPAQAAVVMLDKDLSIAPAKGSSVIEVSLRGKNPAAAAAFVNSLVNLYIDKRTEVYRDPKTVMFLDKKTEEYRQKVADAENKLKAFKDSTNIVSFDDQRTALLTQRVNLVTSLNAASNQIMEVQERIAELEKQMQTIPKNTQSGPGAERKADSESRLLALQLQEKELLSRYKEDNRLVANVREQIQLVKQFLDNQSSRDASGRLVSTDPVYQDLQKQALQSKAEWSSLKVRKTALEQELADANSQLEKLASHENKYRELQRDVTNTEEKYRSYRQRLEEARILDELERQKMTSVSIVEPAAVPLVPSNPLKPMILYIAIAFAIGIFGSLGLGFLLESQKSGVSTPAEAERRLGLPVLVAVPYK